MKAMWHHCVAVDWTKCFSICLDTRQLPGDKARHAKSPGCECAYAAFLLLSVGVGGLLAAALPASCAWRPSMSACMRMGFGSFDVVGKKMNRAASRVIGI